MQILNRIATEELDVPALKMRHLIKARRMVSCMVSFFSLLVSEFNQGRFSERRENFTFMNKFRVFRRAVAGRNVPTLPMI